MREMTDPLSAGRAWSRAGGVGPPVDLYETTEAVIIRMAVPGAEGTSLALTIEDEHVTLRGETPAPGSQWGERTVVHWQEIPFGRFERRVPLPSVVQKDTAKAHFRNGVLEIVLAKATRPATRTIQINVA